MRVARALHGEQEIDAIHELSEAGLLDEFFHFKVLVLIEVQTRLPLAMKIVPIQAYEGQYLLPFVEQAQANLGSHAHIVKIVIDRGYLDGEDRWQLNERGIVFVVVAKAAMAVAADARALAARAKALTRERVIRHGHGWLALKP